MKGKSKWKMKSKDKKKPVVSNCEGQMGQMPGMMIMEKGKQ
jgi:hypothetical protein